MRPWNLDPPGGDDYSTDVTCEGCGLLFNPGGSGSSYCRSCQR